MSPYYVLFASFPHGFRSNISNLGTCGACKKGFLQMCSSPVVNGETKQGGYGEYVLIQAKAAVKVPDHVDASQYAPVLCAGVTAFNALRHMGITPGETVAIQGIGGVGHMAIQVSSLPRALRNILFLCSISDLIIY